MTDNTNPDRTGDPDTPPRQHAYLWRNKYLTAEAKALDDMITSLQGAADRLREMKAAGVALVEGSGAVDDYSVLVTTDPVVAERFGFETAFDEDDLDDLEFEDDPQEENEGNGVGRPLPVFARGPTTGELRGWVHTIHLYQSGLPDLEMRDVPVFLYPEACGLLYKLANEMLTTRQPFRAGQTIFRDQGYLRFVTPVPIPGKGHLYRYPRLQIVYAEPEPAVTETSGPHTEWTRV